MDGLMKDIDRNNNNTNNKIFNDDDDNKTKVNLSNSFNSFNFYK